MMTRFSVFWYPSRYGEEHEVAAFLSWNDAKAFLTCIDNGLRQYFASIYDENHEYHFLVTRGAGPLEVISMQDYPNLSIDDVLFK